MHEDAAPLVDRPATAGGEATATDLLAVWTRQMLLALVAFIVLINLVNAYAIASRPWESFPSDALMLGTEQSPAAWISSVLLLIAGAFCLICRTTAEGRDRWWWLAMGGVLVFLSLDEVATLHERVGDKLNAVAPTGLSYGWIVPAIMVAFIGLAFLRFILRLPRATKLGMLLAGAVFVGGATGVDLLGGLWLVNVGKHNYVYFIFESLEENVEMLGELIAIVVLSRHARATGIKAIRV